MLYFKIVTQCNDTIISYQALQKKTGWLAENLNLKIAERKDPTFKTDEELLTSNCLKQFNTNTSL